MASEVEDTLKRIQSHRGVIGTIVVNNEGLLFSCFFYTQKLFSKLGVQQFGAK